MFNGKIVDMCKPVRHFFANLYLCQHETKIEWASFETYDDLSLLDNDLLVRDIPDDTPKEKD